MKEKQIKKPATRNLHTSYSLRTIYITAAIAGINNTLQRCAGNDITAARFLLYYYLLYNNTSTYKEYYSIRIQSIIVYMRVQTLLAGEGRFLVYRITIIFVNYYCIFQDNFYNQSWFKMYKIALYICKSLVCRRDFCRCPSSLFPSQHL